MMTRTTPVLALLSTVGLATGLCFAQAGTDGPGNDYCVIHRFDLRTQGNLPPTVRMLYDAHVRARTNSCKDTVPGPKDNSGVDDTAPFFQFAQSGAPDSSGRAECLATITTLVAGRVIGTFEANGRGTPSLDGCPTPAPRRSFGSVRAWSSTKVQAQGRKQDRRGTIKTSGNWKSTETIGGSLYKTVVKDPVTARLIDHTTGAVTEYQLLSMKAVSGGGSGSFEWDGSLLRNSAPNVDFTIRMNSPVTVQQGSVDFQVRGGIVTRSIATGEFAALGLPPVGASGDFAVPLGEITMDFDLGGNENHDLSTEFDFDNAGAVEKVIAADGLEAIGGCIVTDLGTGPDGAPVSEITLPDVTMGFNGTAPVSRLARRLDIPPNPMTVPIELVAMTLSSYGAIPNQAYVRIWAGMPGQSALIAGDLTTNRLMDVEPSGVYRVPGHNHKDPSRPLQEVTIDLKWVPPLPPQGEYWIEFTTRSQTPSGQTFVIQSPWESHDVASLVFDTQSNQWRPTMDQGSNRLVTLATNIFIAPPPAPPTPCYANCDGSSNSPLLTPNDFQCFLNKYAAGDPYANCDGSTGSPALTPNDFQCFLNKFAAGCS